MTQRSTQPQPTGTRIEVRDGRTFTVTTFREAKPSPGRSQRTRGHCGRVDYFRHERSRYQQREAAAKLKARLG